MTSCRDASFTACITPGIYEYTMSEEQDGFHAYGNTRHSSTFASANFETAGDTTTSFDSSDLPSVISQSLSHHIQQNCPPRSSGHATIWRKRLKEIMMVQTESILDFLVRPATEQVLIGPIESLLSKYSLRKEHDPSAMKSLQDILGNDPPGFAIGEEIAECLAKHGPSSMNELRAQVSALIDLYKETGEKIFEAENQIKLRIEKLVKIHKQVSTILDLQVNSATEDLVAGMEKYLQTAGNDLGIEELYKEVIILYNKHILLREAIQVFKTGSCLPSEPLCAICLTDTVSYAIVSCGHTFCTACSRKMVYECGICRGKIRERMRIYLS